MDFAFSEEQEELRETLRRFFEEKSPTAEVFRLMETREGYDPAVWKQMGEDLGLQGVHIPEEYGGQGFGFLELGLVLEEMGRVLMCSPYFSTVCLAANVILNAGTPEQKAALLPTIATGESIATLALLDGGGWDPGDVSLEARRDDAGFVLNGTKQLVTDGAGADLIVVAARQPGSRGREGLTLLTVRSGDAGLSATPVDGIDATRKLATLGFDGVRAELLGDEGGAADALAKTLDQACVALAIESAGGAARCLESAVAYAKERVQFARPIGSFQAIKHKCAEVLLEVESARSLAYWASWVAEESGDELALAAPTAKSFCDEAFQRAASENLHIHGGIGFTWAADPHLYLKRAKATETLLGGPAFQRARIAFLKGF